MGKAGYYHIFSGLVIVCFAFAIISCTQEPTWDSMIESVVLYSKYDAISGGTEIYIDLKNKGGVGSRKTVCLPSGEVAEFYNVAIINNFRHKFVGRKRICFDKYSIMMATCGAEINNEHISELALYN